MPFLKKKTKKMLRRGVRQRYGTRYNGKKAYNIGAIMADVTKIKRSLNVEHKHLDYQFGSGQSVTAQYPTKDVPIVLALPTPIRGTSYNERVGNQIRIVHMTMKLEVVFNNNNDLVQRTGMKAQILFSKSADDVPDVTKLYELDANGHYTRMSFANTQEWNKYKWIKSMDLKKSYTQPTNRYPPSQYGALAWDPTSVPGVGNFDVEEPRDSLNKAPFFLNSSAKTSIRVSFKNLSEDVEQYKPYLFLRSDVIDATIDYDPIAVTGQIRMTYVDN